MFDISKFVPIKKEELAKFLVVSFIMVMILFIYSAERAVKDTIIVGDESMGAEALSAIKLFGTLPSAILIMIVYTKLSNSLNKTVIFHLFNVFFVSYFIFFTFVIQKDAESFHINLSSFKEAMPSSRYVVAAIEKWSYSLYYIFAELWGSVMLSLTFWQTANQVFKVDEAKRLYPLFGFVAQLGLITSGEIVMFFSNKEQFHGGWEETVSYINTAVLVAAVILSTLYWVLSNKIVSSDIINAETKQKKKKKPGLVESLKYVFSSKYIGLIATLIVCYGISINIVEGVWKAQAKVVYPDQQDYSMFMAYLQRWTALASMVCMLVGSYVLRLISWRFAAMLTPIAIFLTGGAFFILSIYQNEVSGLLPFLTVAPVVIAVVMGLVQNVLAKSVKYAFFDATKEMAYIPLDEALKSKGKAAADVIGGRLGKSGGALLQQFLLFLIPGSSLITLSPTLSVIFVFVMVAWIIAVNSLSKEFDKLNSQNSGNV